MIWATGYRDDTDWVAIPEAKDEHGNFLHQRGFSLRGLVSTSSDEAGSGRADLPCSPGSAKTPRI